ncbi:MAG TPA: PAS domain S-box protein [Pyrinomonadaceae bacterium]|nr:PAS domain S-box protein [Pyrinomonadaceae bacterium]
MKLLKVLIVEDSEMDSQLILRQLAKSDYEVQSLRVQRAADLKKALSERDWDIVLSDYVMPGFSGLEALRILKESGKDIPFIIISGTIGEDVAVEAMRVGVNDYLMKDNLTRLSPAIERELENGSKRKAQKQAEESLRQSKSRLANAMRIAQLGGWDWDIQNNQLSWSEEIYRIFALSETQFDGTFEGFLNIVHPDDRQMFHSAVGAALAQKGPFEFEHRIIRPNGEERMIREIGEAAFDESGNPLCVTGTMQDITERRLSERLQRESEERLSFALGAAEIGDWDMDLRTNVARRSLRHDQCFGYSEVVPEWGYDTFLAHNHPDDRDRVDAAFQQAMSGQGEYDVELRTVWRDGSLHWLWTKGRFYFDDSGKPYRVAGIVIDITARKLTEEALEKAAKRERAMIENAPDVICTIDAKGNIVTINPASLKVWGFKPEELVGKPYIDLVVPEDVFKTNEVTLEILSGVEVRDFENRLRHKNGSTVNVNWTILWSETESLMFCVAHDITERKKAETEMRLMKSAIDSIGEGIVISNAEDPNYPVIYTNAAFEKLTGYRFEEIQGQNCRILQGAETNPRTVDEIREAIKSKTPFRREILNYRKNGEPFWNELSLSPVFNESGHLTNFVGVQQDISARKQAEITIRASESKFKKLIESSIIGIIITSLDGNIIEANDIFLKTVGYTREELRDGILRWDEMTPPELLWQDERAKQQLADFGFSNPREKEYFRKDGSRVPVMVGGTLLQDPENSIIAFVLDISEQKRAEEALRESEIRLRTIVETEPECVKILGLNGELLEMNPAGLAMIEADSIEQVRGSTVIKIVVPEHRRAFSKLIRNVLAGSTEILEFEIVGLKGRHCWLETHAVPMRNQSGEIISLLSVTRDITERRGIEAVIRRAEDKYRNLVESSPAIAYLAEPHPPYSTIYVSPNVTRFGYTTEEWFKQPDMWVGLIHSEDRNRVLLATQKAIESMTETDLEYRIVAKNGTIYWLHDKGRFVVDDKGVISGWQGVMLDITRTKELEEQLRQAQKLESVGLLAGGIAHDFNNMLTAINGYSDLTLRQLRDDDPLRLNIEEIKKAGLRSADLTHQLLAFSRQQILHPVVLNLNETISETIKMLRRVIGENIQLTTTLNHKIGLVKVDPGQFSQIIMNLAVNARDAMPQGGALKIETSNIFLDSESAGRHVGVLPGAYVVVTVNDTGVGMNAEIKQHIFEPFFTTKEVGKGTGLGLATVYGIIKQSGGSIEVESEKGVGTTFKIYLPQVSEQPHIGKIKENSTELLKGSELILLVEDEELVRNLTRQIMEECGYMVVEARDGLEALEIYNQGNHQFDLLMSDIVMPRMGGRELAEKLKTKLSKLRILFTSGYIDDGGLQNETIDASTNFIQKPFSPDALAHKIREILDN